MASVPSPLDQIDLARSRRARELSELKGAFLLTREDDPFLVGSKAVIVLSYANWEGFYNECVNIYMNFLEEKATKVSDASWLLLIGALTSEFESLRARNHSQKSKVDFIKNLQTRIDCTFDRFDRNVVLARSNLDYSRISENFDLLNFQYSTLTRFRNRLDKELVGWRHGVAHGDPPDLSAVSVADHVDFTANLLLEVSGIFQTAITDRIQADPS